MKQKQKTEAETEAEVENSSQNGFYNPNIIEIRYQYLTSLNVLLTTP